MKKFCFFKPVFQAFLLVLISIIEVQAQESKGVDLVQVKVVASGITEASAVTEALRSALTQTSSVFISSNTTLINDELAKDQISMINNGSIAKYEIVEKAIKEDGTVFLTCNVTVSVNKLGSFVQSVGGKTELKGGLFATNIKLLELNRLSEEKAVNDLIEVSKVLLKSSFDYSITNGEPKNNNGNWEVLLSIQITKNENYNNFCQFFYRSLTSISMDSSAFVGLLQLNLPTYTIGLFDNTKLINSTPYFRLTQKYWNGLVKDPEYSYHVNVDKYQQEYITYKNPKDLTKIIIARDKAIQKFGINQSIGFQDSKVFVTHKRSKYLLLKLRSEVSYKLIEDFIVDFSKCIQSAVISNGMKSIDLTQFRELNSQINGFKLVEKKSVLPITFYSDKSNGNRSSWLIDFSMLPKPDYYDKRPVLLEGLRFSQNPYPIPIGGVGLRVNKWEEITNTYSYYDGWTKLSTVEDKRGSDDYTRYPIFDLVFGSYFHYYNDMLKIYGFPGRTASNSSFPLQLTMIGNDSDFVYFLVLINVLTTDEISKVSNYVIN